MRRRFTKKQRVLIKGFVCALTLLLLLIILVSSILKNGRDHSDGQEGAGGDEMAEGPDKRFPRTERFKNVWILEAKEGEVTFYCEGKKVVCPMDAEASVETEERSGSEAERERGMAVVLTGKIADLLLTDGSVTKIRIKNQVISGVVHRAEENAVWIDGIGRLELAEDYRAYRTYGEPGMGSVGDLVIGYDFADFVLENGKICGIFLARQEPMEYVRVLLKTEDFQGIYHERLEIYGENGMVLSYGENAYFQPGERLLLDLESPYFSREGDCVTISSSTHTGKLWLANLKRSMGTPGYRGALEVRRTKEGLVVINQVLLEEYLYQVVPSEMPATYPEEALKAQAICARTYAYGKMCHAGYPQYGAHMDDSTAFQVYNNIEERESTTGAVKSTHGLVLRTKEGALAETYYYSTSCGWGTDAAVWRLDGGEDDFDYLRGRKISKTAMEQYLAAGNGESERAAEGERTPENLDFLRTVDPDDYESDQTWYRWTYQAEEIDLEKFAKRIRGIAETDQEVKFQAITGLSIRSRGTGGVADELLIETDQGDYVVKGENGIRTVLCDGTTVAKGQNGGQNPCKTLLPSGFFILESSIEKGKVVKYKLTGGGYGHGVGMSQNGARKMAMEGRSTEEILGFFYEGCSPVSVY